MNSLLFSNKYGSYTVFSKFYSPFPVNSSLWTHSHPALYCKIGLFSVIQRLESVLNLFLPWRMQHVFFVIGFISKVACIIVSNSHSLVTHICVSELCLHWFKLWLVTEPWTDVDLLSNSTLVTKCIEMCSFHLLKSLRGKCIRQLFSAKCQPFCQGLDVFNQLQVLSTLGGINPPLREPLINAIFVTSPEVSRSLAPVNIEDIISIPELCKCSLKLDTTDSLNAESTVVCTQRCRIIINE